MGKIIKNRPMKVKTIFLEQLKLALIDKNNLELHQKILLEK